MTKPFWRKPLSVLLALLLLIESLYQGDHGVLLAVQTQDHSQNLPALRLLQETDRLHV